MKKEKIQRRQIRLKKELPFHIMLLPGVIMTFIFSYIPMAGMVIAFQKFIPAKGLFGDQKWIGFENFTYLFNMPGALAALRNTISIAFWKIILSLVVPIIVAILLNEVRSSKFRRTVQTAIYLPYFLSWVIFSGVLLDILSPSSGIVNSFLNMLGLESIFFWGITDIFRQRSSGQISGKGSDLGLSSIWRPLRGLIRVFMRRRQWTVRDGFERCGILHCRA